MKATRSISVPWTRCCCSRDGEEYSLEKYPLRQSKALAAPQSSTLRPGAIYFVTLSCNCFAVAATFHHLLFFLPRPRYSVSLIPFQLCRDGFRASPRLCSPDGVSMRAPAQPARDLQKQWPQANKMPNNCICYKELCFALSGLVRQWL